MFLHPWSTPARTAGDAADVAVQRATLRPGQIVLAVRNDTDAVVRVAQIIVDDAYVDFEAQSEAIGARALTRFTIDYPWVKGEAYTIDLLMSSGAMVEYQVADAQA